MKFSRPSSLRNITRRLAAVCRNNNHKPRTLRTRAEKSLAMSWMCSSDTNAGLIENMYKNGLIEDIRIKDAFLKVDRAHYAPSFPYEDSPQGIGHSATISAPHMHAYACKHLLPYLHPAVKPASPIRVLDIGSGSGYLTHVLAELVEEHNDAIVVGLEHIRALKELGEANMAKGENGKRLLERGKVRFRVGDGRKGWTGDGDEGWDVIHVGAAAVSMHQELVDQLRSPGCMFIPVDDSPGSMNQSVWKVEKDKDGKLTKESLFGVRYVPLTDAPASERR